MRRLFLAAVTALAAVLALATPANAIVGGAVDGNKHPNVGGLVSPTQYSDGTWLYCSGVLISPTVFLTAAHCAEEGDRVGVTFDPDYSGTEKVYYGTFHADPAYPGPSSDSHDIAVVVFDKPIRGITPAQLPEAGSLSNLSGSQTFTSVGYGAYKVEMGPGGASYVYNDVRLYGTGTLNATNNTWLRISGNPSTGNINTCYGDSGGPNFLGAGATETNIIAGTTITGDALCKSTNVTYRLDTASVRAFLGQFVTLP